MTNMRKLIDTLNEYTDLYNLNSSPLADHEWDRMYFKLQELEKESGIIYPDSPTQTIRYNVQSELKEVKHNHYMLSLDKCHTTEEVEAFIGNHDWIAMLKLDGLTCSLRYVDGSLVSAESRGNGETGFDITHNVKVISNVPQHINFKGELIVDGEIICDTKTFDKYFADSYANARNFASGSIQLLDPKECEKRKLKFIAWDCIKGLDNLPTLHDKLFNLGDLGFDIVPFILPDKDNDINISVDSIHQSLLEINTWETLEYFYPWDGIVYKWDNCAEFAAAGQTGHHARAGIAFKFQDEEAETRLIDIIYEPSRNGKLTPVAIYEPVEISGSTCNRASLHNLTIAKDLLGITPYKNQKIWVEKSNDIIPQVVRAEKKNVDCEEEFIPGIEVCPVCGEKVTFVQENESKFAMCTNELCSGKLINQFEHFCSREGLNIKGLSKQTLSKLLDWGWINNYVDLWYLGAMYRDEWIQKPGFGNASVTKILDAIESSRKVDLDKFIAALGIPLVGASVAKDLAREFGSWAKFIEAVDGNFNFYDLPNFGDAMHHSIKYFDYSEARELADTILDITDFQAAAAINSATGLAGKTLCVTGKLQLGSRDKAKQLIEAAGGKVTGSVSAKTDYLVNNDPESQSSKNKQAKQLNIPIISEQELLELLG